MRATHERVIAGSPLEGTATAVLANGLYHWPAGRAELFVRGSVGLLHRTTTHTLPVGGAAITFRSEDNDLAWGGGGGVKIVLTPRLSLQPQFRLIISEATGIMGLAAGSIAFGYRF
jgi:hypothetical protein